MLLKVPLFFLCFGDSLSKPNMRKSHIIGIMAAEVATSMGFLAVVLATSEDQYAQMNGDNYVSAFFLFMGQFERSVQCWTSY